MNNFRQEQENISCTPVKNQNSKRITRHIHSARKRFALKSDHLKFMICSSIYFLNVSSHILDAYIEQCIQRYSLKTLF